MSEQTKTDEQATVSLRAMNAFSTRDYETSASIVAEIFPQVTSLNLQLLLISLQRTGRSDILATIAAENVPRLERFPWFHALALLTLGTKPPSEVESMVTTSEQKGEFHWVLGNLYLTRGQVELARQQFALGASIPDVLVRRICEFQLSWPSQEPAVRSASLQTLAAQSSEIDRLRGSGEILQALALAKHSYSDTLSTGTLAARHVLAALNNCTICNLDADRLNKSLTLSNEAHNLIEGAKILDML